MKKAVIFLNGDKPDEASIGRIDFINSFVICADGAYDYAKNFCNPNLLVGDFDSLKDKSALETVNSEKYPVKKNYTDSELALNRAIENGYNYIEIYGAFGGRKDHEFVNYSLLAIADSKNCEAVLRGGLSDVFYVTPQRPFKKNLPIGKTVSLVPYSDRVHILYTKGLLFSAEDISVDKIHIFTTSNCVIDAEVEYCLRDGTALLFAEN